MELITIQQLVNSNHNPDSIHTRSNHTMKFLTAATLFGFAAAAVETVTISNFGYVGVNGYPQISFQLSVDGVSCAADHFTADSLGNKCDNPEWTFDIFEAQGRKIRLHHTVDGYVRIKCSKFDTKLLT